MSYRPPVRRAVARRRLAALLAAVCALPACGDGAATTPDGRPAPARRADGRRNVLVITLDTTRADHLGTYGYPLDITPELDALAARGVVFENAYAPMPQTLPSHATIMTGLHPRQHGALENSYSVDPRLETLAEVFGAEGYETAAFVSALVISDFTGMEQGFDTFDQPRCKFFVGLPAPAEREATEMTDLAVAWAEEHDPAEPFFLWVHYFDPHTEHVAPRRYVRQVLPLRVRDEVIKPIVGEQDVFMPRLMKDWRGYAAEIRYTDAEVGRLVDELDELGLLEDTVVAVVGDHGEGLSQHGILAHGMAVWEVLHRVPFFVVDPDGRHAGTRVAGRVQLADVAPTLVSMALGRAGGTRPDDKGLDLWSLLEGGRSVPDRPVVLERPHYSPERFSDRTGGGKGAEQGEMTAVLMGDHKLIRMPDGSEQLYDLARDPHEERDLADRAPEVRRRLAAYLDDWLERFAVQPASEGGGLSEERRQALEALGYLGGAADR